MDGPSRDEAAKDLVVQGSSGLLSITGIEEGESVRCGYGVTDVTAGLFAAIGILLALRTRDATGLSSNYVSYLGSGVVPRPMGTAFPTVVPYRVLHAQDLAIAIAVGSERLRSAFCRAIERPDLEKHPDYETNAARIRPSRRAGAVVGPGVPGTAGGGMDRKTAGGGIPASLVRNFQ